MNFMTTINTVNQMLDRGTISFQEADEYMREKGFSHNGEAWIDSSGNVCVIDEHLLVD